MEPLDRYALGKKLTWIANADLSAIVDSPLNHEQKKYSARIAITGAPGAGKSTLLGHLAVKRAIDRRVGILAIDPSSPRNGGAILGDRVRMDDLPGNSEIYIRSLGSRLTSDGLTNNFQEMLSAMDDFEFDEVFVETVGVGQAEYAVRTLVDTVVLVLMPESGDMIQAMKAGISEIADILVINKADLPGSQKMLNDINRIASVNRHSYKGSSWETPVLLVSNQYPESIDDLSNAIDQHRAWVSKTDRARTRQADRARYRLRRILEMQVLEAVACKNDDFFHSPIKKQLAKIASNIKENNNTKRI